jgi:hypothetical protein
MMNSQPHARILVSILVVLLLFLANFTGWWQILAFADENQLKTLSNPSHHSSKTQQDPTVHTECAFFTLLAGVNPYESRPLNHPWSYLGYLLQLVVMRYMMDIAGSTMDLVLLLRLDNRVAPNVLPESQQTFFKNTRIKVKFLPQQKQDSWESFMSEKFQLLRFYDHYRQILFLDADVMPLCNLDYYFDLTKRGIFGPNMIASGRREPCQGGFFLLSPEKGDWETIQQFHYINTTHGFGQPLEEPAQALDINYTQWDWYGAKDDQGLLYHWVRYVKKNVTVVNKSRVQQWGEKDDKRVQLVREISNFTVTCPNSSSIPRQFRRRHNPVYRDHHHFTGQTKPWQVVNLTQHSQMLRFEDCENVFGAWAVALRKGWKLYNLSSVHGLIPNISDSFASEIGQIESFLLS